MNCIEVSNQQEFDAAAATAGACVHVRANVEVTAYGSATVRAYGSATVTAYGSATVTAYGSATVTAYDSATVTASKRVAVHRQSKHTKVTGGVVIDLTDVDFSAATEWLDHYGLTPAEDGTVVLFKGVNDQFWSDHGTRYAPGDTPDAPDWKPEPVCGYGLHLSPRPMLTHRYTDPTRYVACTVAVADVVVITDSWDGRAPDKCKVRRVLACVEVDIDGQPIPAPAAVATTVAGE